jgi:hypothetical protein
MAPQRKFVGFDTFEGLPELSRYDTGMGWERGMWAASYESVASG